MPARPVMTVIAGPNGSGKTVLFRALVAQGFDPGVHINADDIALTLPPSRDRDRQAQAVAQEMRDACIRDRTGFTFETVMSHPSKIEEMALAARSGFRVRLIFVGVEDPIINVERVGLRVRMGGHDVPTDKIVSRYHRTMSLLSAAILEAHSSVVFDNSDVDVGHRLVAVCGPGTQARSAILRIDEVLTVGWFRLVLDDPSHGLRARCAAAGVRLHDMANP